MSQYVSSENPDYAKANAIHIRIAHPILRLGICRIVHSSVDFNYQLRGRAIEIGDIGPDWMLSSKAHAGR
jgi:hypothetical protein